MIPLKDDNPSRSFPAVTLTLIALNVLVYLADFTSNGDISRIYAMRPGYVTHMPMATLSSR